MIHKPETCNSILQLFWKRVGILDIGSQENTAQGVPNSAFGDPKPNDEYEIEYYVILLDSGTCVLCYV
jgi:hypothetical protein